jgi:hypothetical protein
MIKNPHMMMIEVRVKTMPPTMARGVLRKKAPMPTTSIRRLRKRMAYPLFVLNCFSMGRVNLKRFDVLVISI